MQDKKRFLAAEAKLSCQKSFVSVTRVGVFICENFHLGFGDLAVTESARLLIWAYGNFYKETEELQCKISETEPARLWRGPQQVNPSHRYHQGKMEMIGHCMLRKNILYRVQRGNPGTAQMERLGGGGFFSPIPQCFAKIKINWTKNNLTKITEQKLAKNRLFESKKS